MSAQEIQLANGAVAIVDAEDVELISGYAWYEEKSRHTSYAACTTGGRSTKTRTKMHRLILGAGHGEVVDHINGNGLDNRKSNLRIATHSQNQINRASPSNNKSGFKGVIYCKQTGRWRAELRAYGKWVWIGRFDTPEEAARAYDATAREYFGEFAFTNYPPEQICPTCNGTGEMLVYIDEPAEPCARCQRPYVRPDEPGTPAF